MNSLMRTCFPLSTPQFPQSMILIRSQRSPTHHRNPNPTTHLLNHTKHGRPNAGLPTHINHITQPAAAPRALFRKRRARSGRRAWIRWCARARAPCHGRPPPPRAEGAAPCHCACARANRFRFSICHSVPCRGRSAATGTPSVLSSVLHPSRICLPNATTPPPSLPPPRLVSLPRFAF